MSLVASFSSNRACYLQWISINYIDKSQVCAILKSFGEAMQQYLDRIKH